MGISVRRTDLRREIIRLDPDWVRTRRRVVEYRFSNGREFLANYDGRGIYGDLELLGQWNFTEPFQSGHILTSGF